MAKCELRTAAQGTTKSETAAHPHRWWDMTTCCINIVLQALHVSAAHALIVTAQQQA